MRKALMEKRKKDNKGFSLVELIVVVLIIAIISVALAPQVMKWVGTSKVSADKSTASQIKVSVEMVIADIYEKGGTATAATFKVKGGIAATDATGTYEADYKKYIEGTSTTDGIFGPSGTTWPNTQDDLNGFLVKIEAGGKVSVTCGAQSK